MPIPTKVIFGRNDKAGKNIPVRGAVLLRHRLSSRVPECKHIKKPASAYFPGYKVIEYWAQSPTEEAIENWAQWAASKFNPGSTHVYPEMYAVFREYSGYHGKTITVIEVDNGS